MRRVEADKARSDPTWIDRALAEARGCQAIMSTFCPVPGAVAAWTGGGADARSSESLSFALSGPGLSRDSDDLETAAGGGFGGVGGEDPILETLISGTSCSA